MPTVTVPNGLIAIMDKLICAFSDAMGDIDQIALDAATNSRTRPDMLHGPIVTMSQFDVVDCCTPTATMSQGIISPSFKTIGRGGGGNCPMLTIPWTFDIHRCLHVEDDGSVHEDTWMASTEQSQIDLNAMLSHVACAVSGTTIVSAGPSVSGACTKSSLTVSVEHPLC